MFYKRKNRLIAVKLRNFYERNLAKNMKNINMLMRIKCRRTYKYIQCMYVGTISHKFNEILQPRKSGIFRVANAHTLKRSSGRANCVKGENTRANKRANKQMYIYVYMHTSMYL